MLLILVLSFLASYILPWYGFAIVAFVVGYFLSRYEGNSFFAGFIGAGLFWLLYIIFIDTKNHYTLSAQVAQLFSDSMEREISGALLVALASVLAAFIGGLSCWSGSLLFDNKYVENRSSKRHNHIRNSSKKSYKLNI